MSDEYDSWPPLPPPTSPSVIELWTFLRGTELRRAEIRTRDDGAAELQFYSGDGFLSGQRHVARELALIEADGVRQALEGSGWTCARCRSEFWIYAPNETGVPCPDCNTSGSPRPPNGFVSYIKRD